MAVKPKKFDENEWAKQLKIKKDQDEAVQKALNAHKQAGLLIGERINVPGESKAYSEEWKKEVDYTDPKKIPGEIKEIQGTIPGLEDLLAHHTRGGGPGLDGFGDPSVDAVIDEIINNNNLSDEEKQSTLQRILGPDYEKLIQQQQQKQSLKIGRA
tara:strand:+ start:33 stop:500 length:468 start_codon:yes stop_codon:yes gene_type:complete